MYGMAELSIIAMICLFTVALPTIIGLLFWSIYQRNQATAPCVNCTAKMRPGDNFCANCGQPRAGRDGEG
ncbi:MAG: hypothetical protein KDD73_15965 [Anaerolineales bacterium]|nr:hypothetical protein [Anaerolineales bacterium]MCB9129287.1 hypothetical protein [Ardenticatenales bacterium]